MRSSARRRASDERDRLIEEIAPLGRVTTTAYDAADRMASTQVNPGYQDQVRAHRVRRRQPRRRDRRRRRPASYDRLRRQGNDQPQRRARQPHTRNTTHVIAVEGIRLARGQVTTRAYDLAGNGGPAGLKNGSPRARVEYDVLERHVTTTDSDGPVEASTYTANDVKTRTDANGHVTTNTYERLRARAAVSAATAQHTAHGPEDVDRPRRGQLRNRSRQPHDYASSAMRTGRKTSTTLPAIAGEPTPCSASATTWPAT